MNLEARIFRENNGWCFDIVDLSDTIEVKGEDLPELLYTHPKTYTHESTADRHANATIDRINRATQKERRTLFGYDAAIRGSGGPAIPT